MLETSPTNPFRDGLRLARAPDPCVFVLFGARGDLARRKILPSIANLAHNGLLPTSFAVLGMGRDDLSDTAFRSELAAALAHSPLRPEVLDRLLQATFFQQFSSDTPQDVPALREKLLQIDAARGTRGNRLFYLSTPPSAFFTILDRLGELRRLDAAGTGGRIQRIIIEKPFGRDLESARRLNQKLLEVFREPEVYRIDHYLGKETVQNVIVLRFANAIFEPLWNHRYIDNVQITVAETLGVEGRGGYYEESGALRDMIQNHLMQLLCLVAMEPPAALDPESIRDERRKVLRCIRPILQKDVHRFAVRGQYGPGSVGGQRVPGYRAEESVRPDSRTETYAALEVDVDNWRWAGVPFYLRTGKRLPKKVSEVAIQFHDVPHRLFGRNGHVPSLDANVLALRIQPDEGISLKFGSKVPGYEMKIRPVRMDFQYGNAFGDAPPEAYERLVLDALIGDPTLFIRGDVAEEAWNFVTPILETWKEQALLDFPNYAAGSLGPEAADEMLRRTGRQWRRI